LKTIKVLNESEQMINLKTLLPAILLLCTPALGSLAQSGSDNELVVCLLADPQLIMVPNTPQYVEYAIKDLSGLDHDFIAVLGDLAQNRARFYEDYSKAVLDKSARPVFSLPGNGDVGAGLDAYREVTGLPLYYTFNLRGIRFIFLGTMYFTGEHNHICNLGHEQLRWLRRLLRSDTVSTTIIFSHPPIFETTWHSEERDHLKPPGSMYLGESLELREMFRMYNNVILFAHGHLHHTYGSEDEHGRGGYYREGDLLHISVGATANNLGSSFLVIEGDGITVKVRDHENHTWKKTFGYRLHTPVTLTGPEADPENTWKRVRKQINQVK
jgi:hypothetical protein